MGMNWKPMNIQSSLHCLGFHGGHGEGTDGESLGKHWVLQLMELESLQDKNTAMEKFG